MTWEEVLRRVGNGEPVLDVLDERSAVEREAFRSFLADMGPTGTAALTRYDAAMRDLDSGVMGARNCWHSISVAQRYVLEMLAHTRTGRALRHTIKPSIYVRDGEALKVGGVRTMRPLCDRDLMAWDGGTFDPEAAAVITERGRFVVAHGQ